MLDIEQETQDFLLVNHPVFMVRDAQGFATLMKVGIGQATEEELRLLEHTFEILKAIMSKQVTNPLLIQYWSMTPYQLGAHMIKFSVKPHSSDTPGSTPTSENYLREAAVQYLSEDSNDAVFDFLVQLYVDDEKTLIENPMQEWKEQDSPFIKLATLKIPAQKFDFEERKRLDEGLSFMPWHTFPEHAPLGSVNLARKKIYQEIAKARRRNLEAARWTPSSFNEQPWCFIVATKQNLPEFGRLLSCLVEANQAWAKNASVLMISVAKLHFDRNGKDNRHAFHDVGAAASNLALQATALGLFAHQMAGFDREKTRETFSIPEGYEPVAA